MSGPKPIVILLTDDQVEQLKEHFAFVTAEANRGFKGILAAQILQEGSSAGNDQLWHLENPTPARMRVGFVPHDKAVHLQKSAG